MNNLLPSKWTTRLFGGSRKSEIQGTCTRGDIQIISERAVGRK
jgi:hypothetical protein